jgi:hypothetical protein
MRQRLALAGQDPDALSGLLPTLDEAPEPDTAFARAKALKQGLENQANQRRN